MTVTALAKLRGFSLAYKRPPQPGLLLFEGDCLERLRVLAPIESGRKTRDLAFFSYLTVTAFAKLRGLSGS